MIKDKSSINDFNLTETQRNILESLVNKIEGLETDITLENNLKVVIANSLIETFMLAEFMKIENILEKSLSNIEGILKGEK